MILRATVANIDPQDAAQHFQAAGLDGTAFPSYGFGAWGQESGTTLEFAFPKAESLSIYRSALLGLLQARGESAAYVTLVFRDSTRQAFSGHSAELWYADGRTEVIG